MTIFLIILLSYFCPQKASSSLSSCFYTQKLSIVSSTALAIQLGGHSYNIVWDEAQTSITYASFALMGFRIQQANSLLSYSATISSINSTNAVFVLMPLTGSTIMKIYFSIILLKTCSGYIELILFEFVAANPPPLGLSATVNVPLSQPISPGTYNYKTSAFLSAFEMSNGITANELQIRALTLMVGSIIGRVFLYSDVIRNNIFPRIWFTYIIFHIPSFNYQITSFTNTYNTYWPSVPISFVPLNFDIPALFNSNLTKKCIIGYTWIWGNDSPLPFEMILIQSGTNQVSNISSVASLNIRLVDFSVFCLQDCDQGYVDMSQSTYYCTCTQYLSLCLRCVNTSSVFQCTSCTAGLLLTKSTNQCKNYCHSGFYGSYNRICEPCRSQCATCNNNLTCITCRVGQVVQGGCTTMDGCLAIYSWQNSSTCLRCNIQHNFYLNGSTCRCLEGYTITTNKCINITGCLTSRTNGSQPVCIACNIPYGFILSNGSCVCKHGYELDDKVCKQVCGDGRQFKHECDDGNSVDGDGCSSECKVEALYKCQNGSSTSPSVCKYYGMKIKLSVNNIKKIDMANQGIFQFKISPTLPALLNQDLNRTVSFSCQQSIKTANVLYEKGLLRVVIDYFEDLEGKKASLTLLLNSSYFYQPNATFSFDMISSGQLLILSKDVSKLTACQDVMIGISAFSMLLFFVEVFTNKMIGVETMNTFQIIYLTHLANKQYTEPYGVLKYLSLSSWNAFPHQPISNVNSAWGNVAFSTKAQNFTLLIMASTLLLLLLAFSFSYIKLKINSQSQEQHQRKLIENPHLSIFLYNKCLFPFSVSFTPVLFLICTGQSLQDQRTYFPVKEIVLIFLMPSLSLVYFYELKGLFTNSNQKNDYYGLKKCKHQYIPIHLTAMLFIFSLISWNYMNRTHSFNILLLAIDSLFLLWKIKHRPYKMSIHNISIAINSSASTFFFIWTMLRSSFPSLLLEENQFIFVFLIILLLLASTLLSIFRVAIEIRNKWRKYQSKKTQKCLNKQLKTNLIIQQQMPKKIGGDIQYQSMWKPVVVDFKQINEAIITQVNSQNTKNASKVQREMNKYFLKNRLKLKESQQQV